MKKNVLMMGAFFAIALVFKPQAIFFAPVAAILTLTTTKPKQWLGAFCSFILTTLLIYLPFFPKNPFYGIYFVNSNLANTYECTTCFTFNFWGIFGNWQNDLDFFLGISKIYWGLILFSLFFLLLFLIKPIKIKLRSPYIFLTTALTVMAFYIFLTRMHERYLFAFFPFLLLSAILLKSKILTYFYLFASLMYFLNLYLVYIHYNVFYLHLPNLLFNSFLYEFLEKNFKTLSLTSTLVFLCMMLITRKFNYGKE
jgi:Gpi18-like mannosyltransferase